MTRRDEGAPAEKNQKQQRVKKSQPEPIECVGATIGRPLNWAQQRVFRENFFKDKRARASNARPYKSYFDSLKAKRLCEMNRTGAL